MEEVGGVLVQLVHQVRAIEPDHADPVFAVVSDRLYTREAAAAKHPPQLLEAHDHGQGFLRALG